jgi:DNA-binding XRE family transcriptional regulator
MGAMGAQANLRATGRGAAGEDAATVIAAALDMVGPRLRRVREQRGLTLTVAADHAGISKSTLSRLENGQRRPSLELLGDRDLVLGLGEAAEFDTQVPHWFGSTGEEQAEVLSIFGRPGERMLVRAAGDHQESHRDPHSD